MDKVLNQNEVEARRLDNMSVNRRSASSVDYYNDQVARVNTLADMGDALQAHFRPRCSNTSLLTSDVNEICRKPKFGVSIENSAYCRGFRRVSSLDDASGAAGEAAAHLELVAAEVEFVRVDFEHVPDADAAAPPNE